MDEPMEDVQVNLFPERRVRAQELQTGTSPYFTRSPKKDQKKNEDTRDSKDSSSTKPRQRQGVLSFTNGRLQTKKPLINPISRDDAGRKSLAETAEETWVLLPGLLATRPDVTNDGYLCRKEALDPARCPKYKPTKVRVVDSDTIDAALALQDSALKPVAVLNMANATRAGGGWQHGALAQEEAICYRSSLIKTLHHKHYPLPDDAAIYSPTVMIIRESMKDGHDLLDFREPSLLDVISVISAAAVCQPYLKKDASGLRVYQNVTDEKLMKEKMRVILRTAIRNGHRQLVLGAFGCGAFGNPNHVVAQLWSGVLQEQEFQGGYWKDMVFAVLDGKGVSNFKVFNQLLDGLSV